MPIKLLALIYVVNLRIKGESWEAVVFEILPK